MNEAQICLRSSAGGSIPLLSKERNGKDDSSSLSEDVKNKFTKNEGKMEKRIRGQSNQKRKISMIDIEIMSRIFPDRFRTLCFNKKYYAIKLEVEERPLL
ncbi:MAG: hypothetical protein AABY22_26440 [Nanoarchaeota archaeon]